MGIQYFGGYKISCDTGTGSSSVCICIYDNIRHSLTKRVSFCSSFKALSTDTSFIKIGVCYQKLSTLEFNFHYRLSSHFERIYHIIILYAQLFGSHFARSTQTAVQYARDHDHRAASIDSRVDR